MTEIERQTIVTAGPEELDPKWLQRILKSGALDAPVGNQVNISRAIIDGTLVIYALDNPPAWLAPVLAARDDDGNTPLA